MRGEFCGVAAVPFFLEIPDKGDGKNRKRGEENEIEGDGEKNGHCSGNLFFPQEVQEREADRGDKEGDQYGNEKSLSRLHSCQDDNQRRKHKEGFSSFHLARVCLGYHLCAE